MWSTNNNMNANLTCNTKKPVHPYEGASFLKRWTFWWVFLYLRSIFGVYSDFFFLSKLAACAQVAQRLIQIGPSATNWKWRHLSYVKRTWINETLWPLRNTMGWRTQQETSASIHRYTTSLCKENHRRKHTFYGHRCDIKVCVCVCACAWICSWFGFWECWIWFFFPVLAFLLFPTEQFSHNVWAIWWCISHRQKKMKSPRKIQDSSISMQSVSYCVR